MKLANRIVLACAGLTAALGLSMFLAGMALASADNESGWIVKSEPQKEGYFFLTGFQYDDSISVSWTGISTDLQEIENNAGAVDVVVSPSFLLILEPGEKYEEFDPPEDIVIPLSGRFCRSYDSFFEGNPYKGCALLILKIYPRYHDHYGKPITILFDAKGEIISVDNLNRYVDEAVPPDYIKKSRFLTENEL